MSGFHAPGARSLDSLPGTRRVLYNGYPLVDSLATAIVFFIFCLCLAVFDKLLLGIGVLLVFIGFMLFRGTGRQAGRHDINLQDRKKTIIGYTLQIISLAPIFLLLVTGAVTGRPAALTAAASCLLLFIAYYRFLPCTRLEGPDGGTPDLEALPDPLRKKRPF